MGMSCKHQTYRTVLDKLLPLRNQLRTIGFASQHEVRNLARRLTGQPIAPCTQLQQTSRCIQFCRRPGFRPARQPMAKKWIAYDLFQEFLQNGNYFLPRLLG